MSDSKRKKLDDKSFQCVLLGMSEESKAYRLYDPTSKKIVVSRDVVFEKDECWDWGRSNKEARVDILEWEDSNEEGSEHDQIEEESEEEVAPEEEEEGEVSLFSSESPGENSSSSEESLPEGGNRRVPFWMEDYISGGEFSEAEEHNNLVLFTLTSDPTTFEEAIQSSKWIAAMDLEIEAIERNGTWELTYLPKGMKKIGVKWVFKTKLNENGEVDKCMARLVAKGYAQQHGIDYTKVFAPVARWDTIRMVIAIAA